LPRLDPVRSGSLYALRFHHAFTASSIRDLVRFRSSIYRCPIGGSGGRLNLAR